MRKKLQKTHKPQSRIVIFCFDMYEFFCGEAFNAISLYKHLKSKNRDVSLYNIVTSKNRRVQEQNKAAFKLKYNVELTDEIDLTDSSSYRLEDLGFDKAVFCGVGIAIDLEKTKDILYTFSKPFFLFARISYSEIKYQQKTEVFKAADSNPHLVAAFSIDIDKEGVRRWNKETEYPDFAKRHKEVTTGMVAHLLDKDLRSTLNSIKPHKADLKIVAASRMCKVKNVYELASISDYIEKNVPGIEVKFYGTMPAGEKAELEECKPLMKRYYGIYGDTDKDPRASALLSFCSCGYVQNVESLDQRDVKLVQTRRFEISAFESLEQGSIPIFADVLVPKSCKSYPFQIPMLNNKSETVGARRKRFVEIVNIVKQMSDEERAKFCRKWYRKAYKTMLPKKGIRQMMHLLK